MDANRKKYYEHFTKKTWSDPSNYDITLNTENLGLEKVVDILAASFNNKNK